MRAAEASSIPAPPSHVSADVAIVGGGPVGCVAALAFAKRGARVCLVDAGSPPHRLAGEWLHPTGASILADLGVDLNALGVPHALGRGFAIFPPGAQPIVLPYVGGELGVGCQHHLLVGALQILLRATPGVTLLDGCRVGEVVQGRLTAMTADRASTISIQADLIVGADGRQSLVRQELGYTGACKPVSYMAGVLIDAAALPVANYGNVLLGGPGPVLAFRVDANHARVCLDVPADRVNWLRKPAELLAAYRPTLPPPLFAACAAAIAREPLSVAANQLLPRRQYGRAGIALIGDAVGHCHPLCAVGMSVGFLDAVTLMQSKTVEQYARERRMGGRVPEMVSTALYDLFVSPDAGSAELREAVFHLWRTSAAARHDTMRLLAVRETRRAALGVTYARLLVTASRQVLLNLFGQPVSRTLAAVTSFGRWTGWFARQSLIP